MLRSIYQKRRKYVKATGIVRNIDELGRIVIPKEMRTKMDMKSGDAVEIFVEGGNIILSKYNPACLFCGSADDIVSFKDKNVCCECMRQIGRISDR